MASIEPYETGSGRRYRVRYRDPEMRSKERAGFRTRRDAELFIASVTVTSGRGEYIDSRDARVTVGDLGPAWLSAQLHLKPSSYGVLESAWRVYVAPRWSAVELGRVRHSEVQLWVKRLVEGTAPSIHAQHPLGATSVIRAYGILASILDLAVLDRRLTVNPARGVHLPRKQGKRHAYLSHQQVELLAQCAKDKGTLVRFLCYTGLRWGEAVALHVRDVDQYKRRISVVENAVRVGGRIIVGTPKSHHARRVPVPTFLMAELIAMTRDRKGDALVFGDGVRFLNQPTVKGG